MSDFRKTKDRRAGTWKFLKKLDGDASLGSGRDATTTQEKNT